MDFFSLILFQTLYYVRPQEWISAIKPLRLVTLTMIIAIVSVFSRPGGFSKKELFRTPHDWLILFYCLWMIITSPNKGDTFRAVYPLYLSYAVGVQALYSIERIRKFLFWWAIMIFILAAIGVLSEYGFDPTGAYDITHGRMKDRLVVNTSLFNNPNALGHSCVPAVVMLYFLLIWKRPIFVRIGAVPLFAVPLYGIYLTESKGAFISCFCSAVGALTFGRPRAVQILVIFLALTTGWAAVKTLPRMKEIEKTKTDPAIQGRVKAWEYGYKTVTTTFTGVGKDNFVRRMQESTGIYKAAHSSYVQIGCELGRPGLYMFIAILYCCLRTLCTARSRDTEEERVRRILFSMVISYMVSSWMVDFAYRIYFFSFVASVAAYHRLLLRDQKEEVKTEDEETAQEALSSIPSLAMGGIGTKPAMAVPVHLSEMVPHTTITVPISQGGMADNPEDDEEAGTDPGLTWNRFGWFDFVGSVAMLYGIFRIWQYAIAHV